MNYFREQKKYYRGPNKVFQRAENLEGSQRKLEGSFEYLRGHTKMDAKKNYAFHGVNEKNEPLTFVKKKLLKGPINQLDPLDLIIMSIKLWTLLFRKKNAFLSVIKKVDPFGFGKK